MWTNVSSKERFGVAICNFKPSLIVPHSLNLIVGDIVYIYKHCDDWYYGCFAKKRGISGIFPKKYVYTKDSVIDKTGPQEEIIPREPPIVQEITSVLREWESIWKEQFVRKDPNFMTIRNMMLELIDWRSQILSGNLPIDEIRELKQKISNKIDQGNALLKLDLVVRNDQGGILNPELTSTIELYEAHVSAKSRIEGLNLTEAVPVVKQLYRHNHNLYVNIQNFICCVKEDTDLSLALYDAFENQFITENYCVQWGKGGFPRDWNQFNQLHVLFSDLGAKDLSRERIYLVCQVTRNGPMEVRDPENLRKNTLSKRVADHIRRPVGVAAMEITSIINGKVETTEDQQHFIPFIPCAEKDFMHDAIKAICSGREKGPKTNQNQGLWVCLKLLHGDHKQLRDEYPHLVNNFTSIAQKMGFPEVILPGDVRNDLYLTLVQGDFSNTRTGKKSERNIEVTIKVCNEKGSPINGVLAVGAGGDPCNEYKSLVYYHQDKPEWFENLRVAVPIEEFYGAHLKFLFKHRSSSENKDKNEKPFAISYARLMHENGTTVKDGFHELLVYKIDHKKYPEYEASYLNLPSTREEYTKKLMSVSQNSLKSAKHHNHHFQTPGLSLNIKDSFTISTLICSTKLTQNIDLLGLLKWREAPDDLEKNLKALMKVDGEEVVKFLQDTLDALFNILMDYQTSDVYDDLVFEALIFIISLVSDRKYHHFRPILDTYIEENFSATLAYGKLISVFTKRVQAANNEIHSQSMTLPQCQDALLRTMKSMEYIFKFIVRSRVLFATMNGGKGRHEFEDSLKELFNSLSRMMISEEGSIILVQGACLKYFPSTIKDLMKVYDSCQLSFVATDLITNIRVERLTRQKMTCIRDVIHSQLFHDANCRSILLPVINDHLRILLEKREEMQVCVSILSDILTALNSIDHGPTFDHISDLMISLLRTISQTVIETKRDDKLIGNLVAILLSIFRQMTSDHHTMYMNHFDAKIDLQDFLVEILMVFKDLVSNSVFPKDWNEMLLMQNSIILGALRQFATTIKKNFLRPQFVSQVWNNFFHCAIAFLTQESLQLERFLLSKRNKILARYRDMRVETAEEIRSMWFSLDEHKIEFIPDMVGPFLEMALVPEAALREATIPIFYDMMLSEFYSAPPSSSLYSNTSHMSNGSMNPSRCNSREMRGEFREFEREMITRLDVLVEGGRGDEAFKELFFERMKQLCESNPALRESGILFVMTVRRLLRRLLEYRSVMNDEIKENRMSCTVSLLEFYHEIGRQEMYLRYLYKLVDLHLEGDNFVEAAFTLLLHARLLNWSDDPLPHILRAEKYPSFDTNRELKERLYQDIIDYLDKGKLWETGLNLCKELMIQYESELYDYSELSLLLKRMATFYDNIMKVARPEPEYFRVAYYGKGFPPFLQNKTFIYRGREYERLQEFNGRLLNQFPHATLMTTLTPPDETILESDGQYLQINKVDPTMSCKTERFKGKPVTDQILKYYKMNDVQKFVFSRPIRKGERDSDNEFATMWIERTTLITSYPFPGILRWFPVTKVDVRELNPLETAIETMETTNSRIKEKIMNHKSDPNAQINPLSMLLKGVIDAAVMGGISNYEKAFFTEEYLNNHSSPSEIQLINKLKDVIACQIPLLEVGLSIHKQKAPPSLQPFHEHLEETFSKMKESVEEKYGRRSAPLDIVEPIKYRRNVARNRSLKQESTVPSTPATPASVGGQLSGFFERNLRSGSVSDGKSSRPSISLLLPRQSTPNAFSSTTLTNRWRKKKDRSNQQVRKSAHESQSHFYSELMKESKDEQSPSSSREKLIELTEQLTCHRPLRPSSDQENKRMSRPSSGSFNKASLPSSPSKNTVNSSQLSLSPVSSMSLDELDSIPPPLPAKQSSHDYSNFSPLSTNDMNIEPQLPKRKSPISITKNKPLPPLPSSNDVSHCLPDVNEISSTFDPPPPIPKRQTRSPQSSSPDPVAPQPLDKNYYVTDGSEAVEHKVNGD